MQAVQQQLLPTNAIQCVQTIISGTTTVENDKMNVSRSGLIIDGVAA